MQCRLLSKLWKANLEASSEVCGGWKLLKTEFVGDDRIYKMRLIIRLEDGKVADSIDEAPFRFLEEDTSLLGPAYCRYPQSGTPGAALRGGGQVPLRAPLQIYDDPYVRSRLQPERSAENEPEWSPPGAAGWPPGARLGAY